MPAVLLAGWVEEYVSDFICAFYVNAWLELYCLTI